MTKTIHEKKSDTLIEFLKEEVTEPNFGVKVDILLDYDLRCAFCDFGVGRSTQHIEDFRHNPDCFVTKLRILLAGR